MRGANIFKDLFTEETVTVRERAVGKGRSSDLDARRNEVLLLRYIYYGLHTQLRWEVILGKLEDEFYISQRRITDIIQENASLLRQHRGNFPSIAALKKKYPHLVW